MNRRTFMAAPAAAYASGRAAGANDRIRIGVIGCGRRGLLRECLQFCRETNAEVAAVCDAWRPQREKAAAQVREALGSEPTQTARYAEVLARRDIDAVIVGTPDHQHCTMLAAAVRAGKDVYVEKPLAMEMKELIEAVDAVKQSRRVVQVGTQNRSKPNAVAARAFVLSGGLGKILKVEQSRNAYRPYWHGYAREIREADVDWKAFLMHRKPRPFDGDQYTAWYGYRDFSRGPHANLAVHFIDLVHFITGAKYPVRAVTLGGIYRWKDARNCPDSVETVLEYPEGFLLRYSTVFGTGAGSYLKFIGTRGMMDAGPQPGKGGGTTRNDPYAISGEGSGEPDRLAADVRIPPATPPHHMKNWLECLRTRKDPVAPIDAGYAHSVAVILADEAYIRGRRMTYNPEKRTIQEG